MLFHLVSYAKDDVPDFQNIPAGSQRVDAFVQYLVPKIEYVNQQVCQQRKKIINVLTQVENNKKLSENEKEMVNHEASLYQLNISSASEANLSALLSRVNIIPISIVLAQAAVESGWGTSRFARVANNYFGEHCFEQGCGIPANKDSSVEVSQFSTVIESIQSYYLMLNSRTVFADFRKTRQIELEKPKSLNIENILTTLTAYSGIGDKYPEILDSIIKKYHFEKYDTPYSLCLSS